MKFESRLIAREITLDFTIGSAFGKSETRCAVAAGKHQSRTNDLTAPTFPLAVALAFAKANNIPTPETTGDVTATPSTK